jgi:hypothetical protein
VTFHVILKFKLLFFIFIFRLIVLQRVVYTKGKTLFQIQTSLPSILRLVMPIMVRRVKSQTQAQGMGRHTKEEAIEMGMKDLRAMSAFLGILIE